MIFEYDSVKAIANSVKHEVTFELAKRVWDDPCYALLLDRFVDGEQRYHAIGLVEGLVILVVVHMYPDADDDERVRIISARRATAHERRRYEEDHS